MWREECDEAPAVSIQPGHTDDDPLGLGGSRRMFSTKAHVSNDKIGMKLVVEKVRNELRKGREKELQ